MMTQAQQNEIAAIAANRPAAWSLAEKYAGTWPQIAGNAERAAQYIDNGQIYRSQTIVTLADGSTTDLWIVGKRDGSNGEHCTHAGNRCTCSEAAISDPKFGRLCSHRIAVMMYKRLQAANLATLIALIRYMDESDPDANVTLNADRYYAKRAEDRKLLRYISRAPASVGARVDFDYTFEIDDDTIAAAMAATGRTLEGAPQKRSSFRYSYILAAMPPALPGNAAADLRAVDATAKDNAADRRSQLYAEGRALANVVAENERRAA